MRYVSYTRALSWHPLRDNEERVIGVQNEHIRAYAKKNKFAIRKTYSDRKNDPSEGKGFTELIEDGIKREFDCVVVDSPYRCGRSYQELKDRIYETLYLAGIAFIVVEDDFISYDHTPEAVEDYINSISKCPALTKKRLDERKRKSPLDPLNCAVVYVPYGEKMRFRKYQKDYGYVIIGDVPGADFLFLTIEEMTKLVKEKMGEIQEKAEKIQYCIVSGQADAFIEDKLKDIRKAMIERFEEVSQREMNVIKLEEKYHAKEITKEEFERERKIYREKLMENERFFQELTKKADEIEKIYSVKNPWLALMNKWVDKETITKADTQKFIKEIRLFEDGTIEISTRMEEWKPYLEDMLKELSEYGKEK